MQEEVDVVTSLTSLDGAEMPMYRAFEVGEVRLRNLTLTSLEPHYLLHESYYT
jgi:hypothetical protein